MSDQTARAFAACARSTSMENPSAFRLSRIQAEGWNAARKHLSDDLDDAKIARLNPYDGVQERARWHTGFTGALEDMGPR
jgi:hypothetical protein